MARSTGTTEDWSDEAFSTPPQEVSFVNPLTARRVLSADGDRHYVVATVIDERPTTLSRWSLTLVVLFRRDA